MATATLTPRVSIHAPWEGCDLVSNLHQTSETTFQFTHPGKGATVARPISLVISMVSIHAPWEGCDGKRIPYPIVKYSVSIHAPWEGCDSEKKALSKTLIVSIHAPWEGCDCSASIGFFFD